MAKLQILNRGFSCLENTTIPTFIFGSIVPLLWGVHLDTTEILKHLHKNVVQQTKHHHNIVLSQQKYKPIGPARLHPEVHQPLGLLPPWTRREQVSLIDQGFKGKLYLITPATQFYLTNLLKNHRWQLGHAPEVAMIPPAGHTFHIQLCLYSTLLFSSAIP